MSKAGKRLLDSARQARQIARGDIKPASVHIPAEINVKAIRQKIRTTQDDFASEFGFTINQIRDWEQARSRPLGSHRAYLMLINRHADLVRKLLREVHDDAPTDDGDIGRQAKVM